MELAIPTVHKSGNSLHVSHGNDGNLVVEFYKKKELLTYLTDETGEIKTKDAIYVRIYAPGDTTRCVDRPIKTEYGTNPPDAERWPEQWRRFQEGENQLAVGTPLIELGLGDNEIRAYAFYNIHTIEHLSNVPDGLIENLPLGTRGVRTAGVKFLKEKAEKAASNEAITKLVEAQAAQIADMQAQIAALAKPQKTPKQPELKETTNGNSN